MSSTSRCHQRTAPDPVTGTKIMLNQNNKLGIYKVGEFYVHSKFEAIQLHTRTGIHPHWDFNESVFSLVDWTVEPTEDILTLYKQRAEQLRHQYDYIVLMYSGGSDSQTILESFVDNNIHLEEICSWVNYKADADKHNYLNEEIFHTAMPRVEHLKQKYRHVKHRIIDNTDMILDHMSDNIGYNWIYNVNHFFGPGVVARENIGLKIKEWQDIIMSGKKFCVLWGKDKPRVHHINGKFAIRFLDFVDDAASMVSRSGNQLYTDEFFFWTSDFPKILVKQGHMIKNYLSVENFEQCPFVSEHQSGLSYREVNGKKYWLSVDGSNYLTYPNWVNDSIVAPKPPTIVISQRDSWFYAINNHPAKTNVDLGLSKLVYDIPDYWKNNPNDFSAGIKGCWSKPYFLE